MTQVREWESLLTNQKKICYILKKLSYVGGRRVSSDGFTRMMVEEFNFPTNSIRGHITSIRQQYGFIKGANGGGLITITDKGIEFIFNNQKKIDDWYNDYQKTIK
ncbi:hypothetical protein FB479_102704 [Brevibacillus sp. AG162]|uniref:hypothetical protein n=1 Tax=Brevibacillus sp. AG162 TaxID=2572910 RepID=UPI00114F7884|nr:hypothetical protein [Brevibacillus sp. AG162]TQK74064.1 hypothetical protein FB479_102704 [Brevibacillus sp. AG162]